MLANLPEAVQMDLEPFRPDGPPPPFASIGPTSIMGARSPRVLQELPLLGESSRRSSSCGQFLAGFFTEGTQPDHLHS